MERGMLDTYEYANLELSHANKMPVYRPTQMYSVNYCKKFSADKGSCVVGCFKNIKHSSCVTEYPIKWHFVCM